MIINEQTGKREHSEETKQKMRDKALARPPMSDQTRERLRQAAKTRPPRKNAPETIEKMRAAARKRWDVIKSAGTA